MRSLISLLILLAGGIASAQQLQVDSVVVDSVWNSDSIVAVDSAADTLRTSRDLYLSFMPVGEGMAQCAVSISIDSGHTWVQPFDSQTVADSGAGSDSTATFADSFLVLDSGLAYLLPCGTAGRVKLRVLGQDRQNIAFRITAEQWQPILAGNPKQVTLGITAALIPGAPSNVNFQMKLKNLSEGLGYSSIAMVWWDTYGNGVWNDSTTALSFSWPTSVPPGPVAQQRSVIAKARDSNGLWSAPCTLSVQFGMTSRLLTMVTIPAGTFQMGSAVPSVPALVSPSDGALNVALMPTLSWGVTPLATSYRVQVSMDSSFDQVIDTTMSGTSRRVPQLSIDSTYYWRVYANGTYGGSAWSGVWTFTTATSGTAGTPAKFLPATFDSTNLGFNASPVHSVTVGTFAMSQTLVTQGQYQAVMDTDPAYFRGLTTAANPVEEVSWYDAALFCNALSKSVGLDTVYKYNGTIDSSVLIDSTGNGYRLPTEAEYEYAYRSGTTTDYYWGRNYPPQTSGDTLAIDSNAVWYLNSPNGPQPVATRKPNAFGLYDISGNLWEWCNDWYGSYSDSSQVNPTGPAGGTHRVLRGGSWYGTYVADDLAASYRVGNDPADRYDLYGFRVVTGAR